MLISNSVEETHKIAHKTAEKVKNGGIVCLYGDLGTGKTEFTKAVAQYFGIDKFSVKSPTYTYIRKYTAHDQNIFHIDLYRLNEIDELLAQEIDELFENPQNIIIIEWADRMERHLPEDRINIKMHYIDENTRKIETD